MTSCVQDINEASSSHKIDEVLATEGFYMGPPVGVSMWPMLRNRTDVMLVKPASETLCRYDVALYHRGGKNVLHRVVGYYDDGYVICGDNCISLEYIPYNDVFGVLQGFYRNGKYTDCASSRGYHAYSKAWVKAFPVRKVCKRSVAASKRLGKRALVRLGLWERVAKRR